MKLQKYKKKLMKKKIGFWKNSKAINSLAEN